AERFTVGGAGVLFVGSAVSDVAVHNDQRRPVVRVLESPESSRQHLLIIGIADAGDVPAVADEAGGDVVGESQCRVPFDGDVVVVVDPAEVGELQVAGQRGSLGRDALHHAAVATQRVYVEVDQIFEPGPVEVGGLPATGDGHADAVGQPLAKRAGSGFDAAGP